MLCILAAVAAVSLLPTLMATPIYRASTVMQIENAEQNGVQVGGVTSSRSEGWGGPDFMATQNRLMQSRALAEWVADDLGPDAANRWCD